jgi:hypothetical protein
LPSSSADDRDSPEHEEYYRQLERKQLVYEKSQNDPSQTHHQSPQYHEDVPPQYNVQQGHYRAFQPPPTRDSPDIYIDNQDNQANQENKNNQERHPERLSIHPFERPSSRQSLGPPSPILPIPNPADSSRPSTGASNNHSRYSTQSVAALRPPPAPQQQQQLQQLQQQSGMARGDPSPNQEQRQQMNMQNLPARQDSIQMESGHDSYTSRQGAPLQGPRSQQVMQNEQGRSTPPLSSRNREDPSNMDYQSLLAKHEELRMSMRLTTCDLTAYSCNRG